MGASIARFATACGIKFTVTPADVEATSNKTWWERPRFLVVAIKAGPQIRCRLSGTCRATMDESAKIDSALAPLGTRFACADLAFEKIPVLMRVGDCTAMSSASWEVRRAKDFARIDTRMKKFVTGLSNWLASSEDWTTNWCACGSHRLQELWLEPFSSGSWFEHFIARPSARERDGFARDENCKRRGQLR